MDSDRAHQLLAAERERIEREIAELGSEAAGDRDESEDRGSEDLYQQEFDAGRAKDLQDQLGAVERAEARLADGKYGLSVESGDPIPDGRLEALPTAERTVAEEERLGGG
jgi:RNA polymerase-binding transcription factor